MSPLDFKSRGAHLKGVGMVGSIPIRSRQFINLSDSRSLLLPRESALAENPLT